ncbi:MAG TPA: hypothetical protein V6C46_03550 [Coleofasciculaceae cyanobacterium]
MTRIQRNNLSFRAIWQASEIHKMFLSLLCMGGLFAAQPLPVLAQAAYGSYIGGGVGIGLSGEFAGNVAFRYKFLRAPISIRTQALIGSTFAIVPTVSYDFPLGWQADAYIGLGASIPLSGDNKTPVGNRTAFAIQPGIDYAIPNSPIVVFGNTIIAIDGYKNGGTAASFQFGAGFRY